MDLFLEGYLPPLIGGTYLERLHLVVPLRYSKHVLDGVHSEQWDSKPLSDEQSDQFLLRITGLFPLNCARWLVSYIVNHTIDSTFDSIGDTGTDFC